MIPSLTEPITKLLNRDRSPFSSRPEPDRFLLLRVSAEFFFFFFFSDVLLCVFVVGIVILGGGSRFGDIIIESMLMDSFINEVCGLELG